MTAGPGCLSAPTTPARQYGQTTTSAPVFAASSNRTLAGRVYGLLLEDHSFDGLLLEGERSPGKCATTWASARSACQGSACTRCTPAAAPEPAPAVPARASTPDSTGVAGGTGKSNLGFAYRVKAGPLAGLALRASQAWHRGNASYLDGDIDETRLVVDYSRSIW